MPTTVETTEVTIDAILLLPVLFSTANPPASKAVFGLTSFKAIFKSLT